VCLRETLKSLEFSVKKLLEAKIETHNAGAYFEVQDRRILSKHGGVTIFEGMQNHTAESIKSLEGFDRAWFEEAQNASDKSLTLLRPTIRKPGSQLWFGWNPARRRTRSTCCCAARSRRPAPSWFRRTTWTTRGCPRCCGRRWSTTARDPDKYAHVWLGEYQRNSRRVFKNWKVEEFEVDPHGTSFGRARIGASRSTRRAGAVLHRRPQAVRAHEAYRSAARSRHAGAVHVACPTLRSGRSRQTARGPRRSATCRRTASRRFGRPSRGRVAGGWRRVAEVLRHHRPSALQAPDRRTDAVQLQDRPADGEVLPVLEDKNNHVIDALRYACEGRAAPARRRLHTTSPNPLRREQGPSEWTI
jgi:phage terminase large subunit